MIKSLLYTIILPTTVFALLAIGIFISRQTGGNQIKVEKPGPVETTAAWLTDGKININVADIQVLQLLPGIGAVLAQRIIDYREINGDFTDISELMNVQGIGEAVFNSIAQRIAVG